MSYHKRIDREHPGCFVFLIDQSFSMTEPVAGQPETSKAVALARAVNNLLYELVLRCVKNPKEGPRHYYDVGVFGYGLGTGPALGGELAGRGLVPIPDLAQHPARVEVRDASTTGRAKRSPIWLDPVADGATPMSEAMNQAGAAVAAWVKQHPDSFPPIVINVSDGAATDGDPMVWAQRITSLSTSDGGVLLFNVNISAHAGEPTMFPDSALSLPDDYARSMFAMSSELPPFMLEMATLQGHGVRQGARGFVFNADITTVVNFLQMGTSTHRAAVG